VSARGRIAYRGAVTTTPVPNSRGVRRRADILDAARLVFAEVGFRGATMAAIAARADVTHAGLLYHFATKEDVLEAVLADGSERGRSIVEAGREGADHLEALEQLVALNASDPGWSRLFSVLLGESVSPGHPLRDRMAERYDAISASLAAHLRSLRTEGGSWSDDDLDGLARVLLAVMDGLQFQQLTGARSAMTGDFALLVEAVRRSL
jgi:AcrR family transcriptional regulator